MGSILVIKLGALGDLVQAEGAIHDIRDNHPGDHLTVMTTPPYRQFMDRCPWVDNVFIDPRHSRFNPCAMMELRKRLRRQRFDRVYDLQQVGRTRFYYHWLFPRVEWLGDAHGCFCFLKRPQKSCAADHFARHLHMAGLDVRHTLQANVSWMAVDVDGILQKASLEPGYIVLIPGASAAHEGKRWPYFRELAALLLERGLRVVTVPGPDELTLCREIPGDMLVSQDGYHDFFTLAGLVKKAAFVVGNDTGPSHIAAHCGCRGLVLYGSHTSATSTGIQHSKFSWLEAQHLADISVDTVWQLMEKQLY